MWSPAVLFGTQLKEHPLRSQNFLKGFRKFHSFARERLLGVQEFSFGPQRSQEEPVCSAIAWVDVWVAISRACGWINACGWNAGMPGSDWVLRSHRDYSAWVRDPKVFFDRGRSMPEGPPLLKERRYLRKDAAEHLWKSIQTQGWKKTRPLWGRLLNPEPVYLLMLLCCSLG